MRQHGCMVALQHALWKFFMRYIVDGRAPGGSEPFAPIYIALLFSGPYLHEQPAARPPTGRYSVKQVPTPCVLSTLMRPECLATTMARAIASPRPLPRPDSSSVKNGS